MLTAPTAEDPHASDVVQRMDLRIGDQLDVATPTTVTSIGTTEGHVFFPSETYAAIAAGTRSDLDPALI